MSHVFVPAGQFGAANDQPPCTSMAAVDVDEVEMIKRHGTHDQGDDDQNSTNDFGSPFHSLSS
jgi:hypothetical protein